LKVNCKDCGREIEVNDDVDSEKAQHLIQCYDCYQEECDYIEFLEQQDRWYDQYDLDDFDDYFYEEPEDFYFRTLVIEKKH
jgi:hypothetical protein